MESFQYTSDRIDDDFTRRMARIFQMVVELHKIGYQGLRIYPQIHHNRFHLIPSLFMTHPGSRGIAFDWALNSIFSQNVITVHYPMDDYIKGKNARQCADEFIRRCPFIAHLSMISDYEYAGWFESLTGEVEKGLRPVIATISSNEKSENVQEFVFNSKYMEKETEITTPKIFLMGQGGDEYEGFPVSNIIKTFPFPPTPKLDGTDLNILMKKLFLEEYRKSAPPNFI